MIKFIVIAFHLITIATTVEGSKGGKVSRLRTDPNSRGLQGRNTPAAKATKLAKVCSYTKAQYHINVCLNTNINSFFTFLQAEPKIMFCHHDDDVDAECPRHNIEVSPSSRNAHLAHGDNEGTCQDFCNKTGDTYDPETCQCVTEDQSLSMLEAMDVADVNVEWGRS